MHKPDYNDFFNFKSSLVLMELSKVGFMCKNSTVSVIENK